MLQVNTNTDRPSTVSSNRPNYLFGDPSKREELASSEERDSSQTDKNSKIRDLLLKRQGKDLSSLKSLPGFYAFVDEDIQKLIKEFEEAWKKACRQFANILVFPSTKCSEDKDGHVYRVFESPKDLAKIRELLKNIR